MFDRGRSLNGVAAAVLDGKVVDWTSVLARATPARQAVLRQLTAIDGIAHAARQSTTEVGVDIREIPLSPSPFTSLLALVAVWNVSMGFARYLLGTWSGSLSGATGAIVTAAVFAAASAWLGVGGRHDDRARNLAVVYLLVSAAFTRRFLFVPGGAASSIEVLQWSTCPDAFIALFLWRFARRFPRVGQPGPTDRFSRWAEHVSLAAGLVFSAANIALGFGVTWVSSLARGGRLGLYWLTILGLALPAIPVAWLRSRLSAPHERQRLAVFTIGLTAGFAPPLAEILAEQAIPDFHRAMSAPGVRDAAAPVFFALLLTVPIATTYSVVVDRVFDVRLAVGRALQYLFAKTTLGVLALLPFAWLGTYAYGHRDLSMSELVAGNGGTVSLLLIGAGAAMWTGRRRVLRSLDQKFFRTRINLARELPRLTADICDTRDTGSLAQLLEARLGDALQAEHATVLLRASTGEVFAPARHGTVSLEVDSGLSELVAAGATPVPVGREEPGSCFPWLLASEQRWVEETRTAVIMPLVGSTDRPTAAIAVGRKRSGGQFAKEELSFLATAASAAALALEVHHSAEPDRLEPATECPACGRVGPPASPRCACGRSVGPAALPAVVAGKFRVDTVLGSGGMGVVYRGYDLTLGRAVALKTLPRFSGRAVAQLTHEAQVMASVVHPNLATIFGVERWRETPILIVEYLEGGTLASRLRPDGLPVNAVLRLGVSLSAALAQLHQRHVLHRDIKPSNIGLSSAGVPKLLDFGIAGLLLEPGGTGPPAGDGAADARTTMRSPSDGRRLAGTPSYLSPEAANGADTHHDFDLWSLALVLYVAIAGSHPFEASTVSAVLERVRRADVPDVRQFRPDCPASVARAFRMMLSGDRLERPRTALALGEVLGGLIPVGESHGERSEGLPIGETDWTVNTTRN